jgi:hypothetical protein
VGSDKRRSALAEICIVNFDGQVVYHRYVKPQEHITGAAMRARTACWLMAPPICAKRETCVTLSTAWSPPCTTPSPLTPCTQTTGRL